MLSEIEMEMSNTRREIQRRSGETPFKMLGNAKKSLERELDRTDGPEGGKGKARVAMDKRKEVWNIE